MAVVVGTFMYRYLHHLSRPKSGKQSSERSSVRFLALSRFDDAEERTHTQLLFACIGALTRSAMASVMLKARFGQIRTGSALVENAGSSSPPQLTRKHPPSTPISSLPTHSR